MEYAILYLALLQLIITYTILCLTEYVLLEIVDKKSHLRVTPVPGTSIQKRYGSEMRNENKPVKYKEILNSLVPKINP